MFRPLEHYGVAVSDKLIHDQAPTFPWETRFLYKLEITCKHCGDSVTLFDTDHAGVWMEKRHRCAGIQFARVGAHV